MLVVTKSLGGFVSNQVQYNMESAQYFIIFILYIYIYIHIYKERVRVDCIKYKMSS